jgi:uracil-DNA glycosylase
MNARGAGRGEAQPRFSGIEDCRRCARLASFLDDVRGKYPTYHARPVPAFGDLRPRLLIVGLAPGMHGANRTGRPFTGDYAGILLYETLHRFGWSSQAESVAADDPLELRGCRITNAVKCLPPGNKPEPVEVKTCNGYLRQELNALDEGTAILALGQVAHAAVLSALELRKAEFAFGHGAEHALPRRRYLFDSYHCSRYNTQTKRLTAVMFEAVFARIAAHLETA